MVFVEHCTKACAGGPPMCCWGDEDDESWFHHWFRDARRQRRRQQADRHYDALLQQVPPKSISEFEDAAQSKLSPLARVYFQYYSDQAVTAQACRRYFQSIRLLPTILTGDVRDIDTRLSLFGHVLDLPVLIAPTAFHVLACPEGEIATARGSGAAGAGYCYNWMLSSKAYPDVLKEPGIKWLHLYMFQERELVEASLKAAEATGAFSAIILTCDHPHARVQGRMLPFFTKAEFTHANPKDHFFPNQAALGFADVTLEELTDPKKTSSSSSSLSSSSSFDTHSSPGGTNSSELSWEDVKWIQSLTTLPVIAKGILSASDARKAMEAGVDGIVVSNHGGRQCDMAVPAIEALPAVVDAVQQQQQQQQQHQRGRRIPVFCDSGVRSSGDIIRALCLGATGVLLGRPALWALTCEGSTGLERMLGTLKEDLQDDLRSLGVTSISKLGMQHLWPPDRERIEQIITSCKKR